MLHPSEHSASLTGFEQFSFHYFSYCINKMGLMLYYYENMTMTEIGLLLEISEARISQIIGKLLVQLKSDLNPDNI